MAAIICPTVTPKTKDEYRDQFNKVKHLSTRLHLDFMDKSFTGVNSIRLEDAWWHPGPKIDLHIMFSKPLEHLERVIDLQPHMVIIQAEAEDVGKFIDELSGFGIKIGVSLLAKTPPIKIEDYIRHLDHVLIFSGHLGHFGGKVDLSLLHKVSVLKRMNPRLEIGWDGGINDQNVRDLVDGGIDVLNVGGFLQNAEDPEDAYAKLEEKLRGARN